MVNFMAKILAAEGQLSRSALRRMREKEQRCQAVLKAAETLFASQGYHQTSMEEIADLAEVSTGAVYFYFKNKEDLLIRLMKEIGFFLRDWLGQELAKNELTIEGFSKIAVAFLREFCARYPEKITIFFRESAGQSREVEEQRRHMFDRLTREIQDVLVRIADNLGRRFISDAAAEVMALCVVGIYERLAYHQVLWTERVTDIDSVAAETVAFMQGGINRLLGPEGQSAT